MSGPLFAVGAVAVVVGAILIGFGIPVSEFSFGNTLIIAGAIAIVGGLIVVGLGVVVAQLHRIAEALATRAPIRSSRPLDMFDSAAGSRAAPGRIPFPPKPKSDAAAREPFTAEPPVSAASTPADESPARSFAPTLHNPDDSPLTVEDDVSLSPQHPAPTPVPVDLDAPMRHPTSFERNESELAEKRREPMLDAGWRSGPLAGAPAPSRNTAYFDAMWPAKSPAKSPVKGPAMRPAEADTTPVETKPDDSKAYVPAFEPPHEPAAAPAMSAEPELPIEPPENEPGAVAILKSGVVDGMGYTLYVDGSIEAELPQGTLRFASINELRAHLEKNA